jgi:hypothetical protein
LGRRAQSGRSLALSQERATLSAPALRFVLSMEGTPLFFCCSTTHAIHRFLIVCWYLPVLSCRPLYSAAVPCQPLRTLPAFAVSPSQPSQSQCYTMSRTQQDQFIDDDEEETCPLCVEEFDLSDRGFRPCVCGYQVCAVPTEPSCAFLPANHLLCRSASSVITMCATT